MVTAEQERKALAQIKKIVDGLGFGSYIATAFEGCFEIAEENIENDFACSMKQRAEAAEAKVETLSDMLKAVTANATQLEEERKQAVENAISAVNELQGRIDKLTKRALSVDRYKQIWTLCYDQIEQNRGWMDVYADTMADFSDHPADIAFLDAVKNYKKHREAYDAEKDLLEYLDTINPEEV